MSAPAPVLTLPPHPAFDALARSGVLAITGDTTPDELATKLKALRAELVGAEALTVANCREQVLRVLRGYGYVDGLTILDAALGRPGDPRWSGVGALEAGESLPTVRVLQGEAPAPPAVLVADLLVDRDINLLAGFGGAFKSVLALLVAICVALGRDVFGSLAVYRSGAVLLVCPEDGEAAVRMMLDALVEGLELSVDERAILAERLVMVADAAMVSLVTDTARLRDLALSLGAVLVLVDPLRNSIGSADENDNAVAGACLDATRRDVCRAAGAAVLMTHHARKPGKDAGPDTGATIHEMRGAGAWAAGARLVFGVTHRAGHVTLTALKANRLRSDLRHELDVAIVADPDMPTRWQSCTVTDTNAGARSESLTPGVGRELNANEKAALACLNDEQEPGLRLSWARWRDESGLNPNTFRTVKDRLLKADLACATPTGKKTRTGGTEHAYAITDTGRMALRFGWVTGPANGESVSEL